MDPTTNTGEALDDADPQTGEQATYRDPDGDRDRGLEVTASETEDEDQTEETQGHDEGNTTRDHPRKLKTGKRTQGTSGCLATHLERDQRLKHPKFAASRLQAPTRKPHQPYVFNSLRPYYSLSAVQHFLTRDPPQVRGHRSRRTVYGLIEPWVDLQMDNDLQSDIDPDLVSHGKNKHTQRKGSTKRGAASGSHSAQPGDTARLPKPGDTARLPKPGDTARLPKPGDTARLPKPGDTARLPKLATISPRTPILSGKQLDNGDVSTLRLELGAMTSPGARRKFLADYQQTRAHFYRSQLHRLDLVHPASRPHVCSSYLAYLQNTPGSRRAITDCMHRLTLSSG